MNCDDLYDDLIRPLFDKWIEQARRPDQVTKTSGMYHLFRYAANYDSCKQRWEDLACQQIAAAEIKNRDSLVIITYYYTGLLTRSSIDATVIPLRHYCGRDCERLNRRFEEEIRID